MPAMPPLQGPSATPAAITPVSGHTLPRLWPVENTVSSGRTSPSNTSSAPPMASSVSTIAGCRSTRWSVRHSVVAAAV